MWNRPDCSVFSGMFGFLLDTQVKKTFDDENILKIENIDSTKVWKEMDKAKLNLKDMNNQFNF